MDISPYFYIQVFFFKRRSILSKILNDYDFEPSFIYKKKYLRKFWQYRGKLRVVGWLIPMHEEKDSFFKEPLLTCTFNNNELQRSGIVTFFISFNLYLNLFHTHQNMNKQTGSSFAQSRSKTLWIPPLNISIWCMPES